MEGWPHLATVPSTATSPPHPDQDTPPLPAGHPDPGWQAQVHPDRALSTWMCLTPCNQADPGRGRAGGNHPCAQSLWSLPQPPPRGAGPWDPKTTISGAAITTPCSALRPTPSGPCFPSTKRGELSDALQRPAALSQLLTNVLPSPSTGR